MPRPATRVATTHGAGGESSSLFFCLFPARSQYFLVFSLCFRLDHGLVRPDHSLVRVPTMAWSASRPRLGLGRSFPTVRAPVMSVSDHIGKKETGKELFTQFDGPVCARCRASRVLLKGEGFGLRRLVSGSGPRNGPVPQYGQREGARRNTSADKVNTPTRTPDQDGIIWTGRDSRGSRCQAWP